MSSMKRQLLKIAVIFFTLGMLMSGIQTTTGYYGDPSAYGYQHLSMAYLNISLALTIFGVMLMVPVIRKKGSHI